MEKTITFRLTEAQKEQLQQLARDDRVSISRLLRRIIDEWHDRQAKDKSDR